jgi:hypothetical protein
MLDMNLNLQASNSDTAAANTITSITLTAPAKPSRWSIGGVAWSYTGIAYDTGGDANGGFLRLDTSAGLFIHAKELIDTPGTLSINDTSGSLVFGMGIIEAGEGQIVFPEPVKFAPGNAVRIDLYDGGGHQRLNILGAKLV